MSTLSKIEWTDATWNPTRGCSLVSPGCTNCYAQRQAHRQSGPGGAYEGLTRLGPRGPVWTGDVRLVPELLDQPLRWQKPRRIFVNSMSDLFHEGLSDEEILSVFTVMALAPQHTFQVLTKRPERMARLLGSPDTAAAFAGGFAMFAATRPGTAVDVRHIDDGLEGIRFPNVWIGVSVEDQATADERIPLLLQTPAAVRFVSYEPALGPVNFLQWTLAEQGRRQIGASPGLSWLIVGGESGPRARPCDVEWIREAVRQCKGAGVPVFVKQLGARVTGWCANASPDRTHFNDLDPEFCDIYESGEGGHCDSAGCQFFMNRKGGDPEEWPEDLRVREFPFQ